MNEKVLAFRKNITKQININYLLYLPEGYDNKEKWPLLLFLHGAGERGNNLESIKKIGLVKRIEEGDDFSFIVVAPQCPLDMNWDMKIDDLMGLLVEIEDNYRVDSDRIYLTGLSMGGTGTWLLSSLYPEKFAAVAPVCGRIYPLLFDRIKHLKDLPVWVFHGAEDSVVPCEHSKKAVDILKQYDAEVKLTIFPETDHDSWLKAYQTRELYQWFLSH